MQQYNYSKTMMMKLFMAEPDSRGGSKVFCDFARALDLVRQTDALTLGAPKILYLVGWQYNGHDDRYPAFHEVNPALKREEDATATDSMLWLMREAKNYNTVISVHINFTDAYDNSPLMPRYRENNALIRDRRGQPAAIENYNGQPCYKISYKEEWESGLFQERVQALLELLPLREAGTVHVDNFQCYVNRKPTVDIRTMQAYRKKMIAYLAENGIDVTSEFTYREGVTTALCYGKLTRLFLWRLYPVDTLGQLPAIWWVDKLKRREIARLYPEHYAGGVLKGKYGKVFYGSLHGEELWRFNTGDPDAWHAEFLRQFATSTVPYFHLATLKKDKLVGYGNRTRMRYADGTVSCLRHQKITKNGITMKNGEDLLLPLPFKENAYIAYSKDGCDRAWTMTVAGRHAAAVYDITAKGPVFMERVPVNRGRLPLSIKPGQGLLVEFE